MANAVGCLIAASLALSLLPAMTQAQEPGTSSSRAAPKADLTANHRTAERALTILKHTPSWVRERRMDPKDVTRIMSSMEELSTYDTGILRIAVEKHLKAAKKYTFEETYAEGRVYLLNRYLFDVPAVAPPGARSFGTFFKIGPRQNWLWPLAIDEDGRLELVATGAGYAGQPYEGIREFDYFRQKFGRRRATSPTKE